MTIDITSTKMPEELQTKLELLTPFARKYAEYRAKGLKQPDSAQKAGSNAKSRALLGKVGWNTEQFDGIKEYILWLEHKRARAAVIDDLEIIDKLRDVYTQALDDGKYSEANKAVEHMGNMIGAFAYKSVAREDQGKGSNKGTTPDHTNTDAFTQDLQEDDFDNRAKKLSAMLENVKSNSAAKE